MQFALIIILLIGLRLWIFKDVPLDKYLSSHWYSWALFSLEIAEYSDNYSPYRALIEGNGIDVSRISIYHRTLLARERVNGRRKLNPYQTVLNVATRYQMFDGFHLQLPKEILFIYFVSVPLNHAEIKS